MRLTPNLHLSATDLTRFMGCQHATMLDFALLRGEGPAPPPSPNRYPLGHLDLRAVDPVHGDGRARLPVLTGKQFAIGLEL